MTVRLQCSWTLKNPRQSNFSFFFQMSRVLSSRWEFFVFSESSNSLVIPKDFVYLAIHWNPALPNWAFLYSPLQWPSSSLRLLCFTLRKMLLERTSRRFLHPFGEHHECVQWAFSRARLFSLYRYTIVTMTTLGYGDMVSEDCSNEGLLVYDAFGKNIKFSSF